MQIKLFYQWRVLTISSFYVVFWFINVIHIQIVSFITIHTTPSTGPCRVGAQHTHFKIMQARNTSVSFTAKLPALLCACREFYRLSSMESWNTDTKMDSKELITTPSSFLQPR